MISDRQKSIYNSFLRATRTIKNLPFNQRSKFDNFDNTKELILKKLEIFFNTHSSINVYDYFIAPYRIYTSDEYFDLQFFITRKAVKCYTEYIRNREVENPDSQEIIDKCKECCSFIYYFCKENNITLQEYKNKKINDTPIVLHHLKDHKLNFYTLHGLEIANLLTPQDSSIYNFMFQDFYETYNATRSKFIRSTRLKVVMRASFKLINERLLILHNNPV